MKIANDIRSIIEDDVKRLTEAFLTGEISPVHNSIGQGNLPYYFSEPELQQFAADIIRFQLESKMLSLIIPFLGTMKWLSLDEACIYSRKSRNTLLELVKTGKIYGTKAEAGEWIIDRESIDSFYNAVRDDHRIHFAAKLRRAL